MVRDVIELTDGYGVDVIVCGNTETLADGCEGIDDEAAAEAVRAASSLICDRLGSLPSIEMAFREWHGGRCYGQRPDLPGRFVVANIYRRDDDGDWSWCGWSEISANMQAEIRAAVDAADDALVASLLSSEAEVAGAEIDAAWNAQQDAYVAGDWVSTDGDEWLDQTGQPVDSPEFHAASIHLVGGPRDGETVG
jgi:hypothetical protein